MNDCILIIWLNFHFRAVFYVNFSETSNEFDAIYLNKSTREEFVEELSKLLPNSQVTL